VFGMHAGCSATQVTSADKMRHCARPSPGEGGVDTSIPYYLLVGLIVATQFYTAKQMAKRATGPAAQQQQMMTRFMPVIFGLISLSIPAGANLYFLASNVWQIGQQHLLFRKQDQIVASSEESPTKPAKQAPTTTVVETTGIEKPQATPARPHPSSKKKRKKKR
ncbi:MAG TPA: YidC/Oxa1 family membrane protein insertase, partial [Actinomycetota bacterium]|nr:YidC/Oxa1 family membrane protein insertase [Actinomycetota bacterium]